MFHEDWYSDDQISELTNLYDTVKDKTGAVIEIGCWEGKSTIGLAKKCFPEVLICNDTWLGNVGESAITGVIHHTELILKERDVYSAFINNMNNYTLKNYTVVKEDCIEWLKRYTDSIKFIHIDASHEYESVFETINLVLPKMVKGGVICGDDYLNSNMGRESLHGGVERAVRETLPAHANIGNLWYCFV
jgi:hypothetical protein